MCPSLHLRLYEKIRVFRLHTRGTSVLVWRLEARRLRNDKMSTGINVYMGSLLE